MPKKNSKLNQEIDAGAFFLTLFKVFFSIGVIVFAVWFFKNVYNVAEKTYIKNVRYAYSVLQKEVITAYEKQKYVFEEKGKGETEDPYCKYLANKYSSNQQGSCSNFNPTMPSENFTFKGKNISIYGLEKPTFSFNGCLVKDVIIDVDGELKGENTVGKDRVILRIYSSGQFGGIITPVNCSTMDEMEYGLKRSIYCIGSEEVNYLILNKPLGFDIQQIGADKGKTRIIGNNISFLRADCSVMDGAYTGGDEYCEQKEMYTLRGCDDEYQCNISLSRDY